MSLADETREAARRSLESRNRREAPGIEALHGELGQLIKAFERVATALEVLAGIEKARLYLQDKAEGDKKPLHEEPS